MTQRGQCLVVLTDEAALIDAIETWRLLRVDIQEYIVGNDIVSIALLSVGL
jgi:TusA-related sulfurtransferase